MMDVTGQTRSVNPKAEISNTVTLAGSSPLIQLDFSACIDPRDCPPRMQTDWLTNRWLWRVATAVNGSKQVLEVPGKNVRDIFDEIDFYCSQIETEYEQAGKSIE